jgi:ADP-ribose pyrophosphatase
MAERPESSEVVFEGPVFTVARERWRGSDRPYDVVRHVGAAGVLPLTPDGDVLLVRQFRPAVRRSLVEIPAGLLDVPGEDPVTCAARELLEETGYRHATIDPLGDVLTTAGFSDELIHLFWASTEREPVGVPEEGVEVVRRPLAEMAAAARAGLVPDAKTALALLMIQGRAAVD